MAESGCGDEKRRMIGRAPPDGKASPPRLPGEPSSAGRIQRKVGRSKRISMRHLIAGNWKMNGLAASLPEIEAVADAAFKSPPDVDILICPPATLVARAVGVAAARIGIGGQDCHAAI